MVSGVPGIPGAIAGEPGGVVFAGVPRVSGAGGGGRWGLWGTCSTRGEQVSRGDVFSGIPGVQGECKGAGVDGVPIVPGEGRCR